MKALNLCLNCLGDGAHPVPVGRDIGTQREPDRAHVSLCKPCEAALTSGRFEVLHERYAAERRVVR